jgi:transglutaminase-like putative cysteine protease
MRFSVRHETRYRYARPIPLAGHRLRFKPRGDNVRLTSYALTIDPSPASRMEIEDSFGNGVTRVWFEGTTDHLFIESRFELETHLRAPMAAPELARLPWSAEPWDALAQFRSHAADDAVVNAFAAGLAAEAGGDPLAFLDRLNMRLFADFDHRIRTDGAAMTPAETLAAGSGACRDLTVLFMAACRCMGLPARFVSGYQARSETPDGKRHLHAWPEVFLPGLGWRGFDPTHGVPVTDGHVALSAAPEQSETMTVEGGYFGESTASTLEFSVTIAAE